jgi:threonine dehydrogenase-like Zn-dependent dehydrogenase
VVRNLTDGVGADVTFEVTGVQAGLDLAGDVSRMSGTIGMVGFHQGEPRQIRMAQWNWLAFRIANGHVRDTHTILAAMTTGTRLLLSGQLKLAPLITHRFSLEQINEAFETAVTKPSGFVKATIQL